MKKVIVLFFAAACFCSCSRTHCYSCTSTSYRDFDSTALGPNPNILTRDYCDWTKDQAAQFEKNSTHYTNGVNMITDCKKK